MAMSRSFGGTYVSLRSPRQMLPSLTSSRPASLRSDVDLPQPDGPTRTRNSPTATSRSSLSTAGRVPPGYRRVALSNVTDAMVVLLLHRQVRAGRSVVMDGLRHRRRSLSIARGAPGRDIGR